MSPYIITDDVLIDMAVELADAFYGEDAIDWDDLIDRLEAEADVDFGSDAESPQLRRIKAGVRKIRRET